VTQLLIELRNLRAWAAAEDLPALVDELDKRIEAVEHDDEAVRSSSALGLVVLLAGFVALAAVAMALMSCRAQPLLHAVGG